MVMPARSVFSASSRRLRETGHPAPRHVRPHEINVQNEENVVDAILENPSLSTRRLANQLQLSQNFVWRTLNKEVLHPYHRQSVQALHPEDNQQRLEFCQWILQQNARNPNFISLVLWSDESCFTRDGITNFHNEHVWSLQNPHAIRPRRFQRRFSVNVWGGIFNNTLLPIQIINDRLNGELYRQLLEHTLYDLIDEVPLNVIANMWYQHDGAPPHRGREVTTWLNNNFPNHWIGNGGPVACPPRSPDLNPLDFYLWGHMKQLVYQVEITNREQLIQRIINASHVIRNDPNFVQRITRSLVRRCEACILAEGGYFEQFL